MNALEWRSFEWQISPAGYEWRDARRLVDNSRVLKVVERILVPSDGDADRQDFPVKKHTGLFFEFAELPIDEEAIRRFATEYGQFRHEELAVVAGYKKKFVHLDLLTLAERGSAADVISGVFFYDWENEITLMSRAIALWKAIDGRDARALRSLIEFEWDEDEDQIYCKFTGLELVSVLVTDPPAAEGPRYVAGAKALLARVLSNQLYEGGTHLEVVEDVKTGFRPRIVPGTLISALWMQFAMAVCENKQFRRCDTCGKPFEVSPEVARTNRRTCSDACKSRAYRQRKATAVKLSAAGKTVRQIAKELDSDIETIEGWLQ